MTPEELQKLMKDVQAARADAKRAAHEAASDPDNPTKKSASQEAANSLAELETKLAAAGAAIRAAAAFLTQVPSTDTSVEMEAYKGRVIGLGVYLLMITLISVYLLGSLMMAKTGEADVKNAIANKLCCGAAANVNANTTNANVANSNNANSNAANSNESVAANAISQPTNNVNSSPGNSNANPAANTNALAANTNAAANARPGAPGANAAPGRAGTTGAPNVNATATPSNPDAPEPNIGKDVIVTVWPVFTESLLSADSYLFLVVLVSGMLGGTIRAMHSFVRHLGLRNFSFYWTWFYISLPFVGGGLSEVIYFVIRGGFYGGSFGKGLVLNLFSFAAMAALTGLFTDQAMEKLKQVAVTLLTDTPPKVENAKEIEEKKDAEKKGT